MTLKFKVTWKEEFFKISYYISGCICSVGEISMILHIIEIRDHYDVTLRMMRDTRKWSTAQIQGQALFRLTLQISVCIRAIHAKHDKTCYKRNVHVVFDDSSLRFRSNFWKFISPWCKWSAWFVQRCGGEALSLGSVKGIQSTLECTI